MFYAPLEEMNGTTRMLFNKMARVVQQRQKTHSLTITLTDMRVAYALRQRENQYLLAQVKSMDSVCYHCEPNSVRRQERFYRRRNGEHLTCLTVLWTVLKNVFHTHLPLKNLTIQRAYRPTCNWEDRAAIWKVLGNITRFMSTVRTNIITASYQWLMNVPCYCCYAAIVL